MTPEELGSKPVFPMKVNSIPSGITYRQYLLGCALQGVLAHGFSSYSKSNDTRASDAAEMAKAAVDTLLLLESEAMNHG